MTEVSNKNWQGEGFLDFDKYLLVTHEKPDGDAWGSLLAMHLWLENCDKDCVSLVTEKDLRSMPYMHEILPMEKTSQELPEDFKDRQLVCLDLAGLKRVGFPIPSVEDNVYAQFDHHQDNSAYAEKNLILSSFPSTTQVLHQFFSELAPEAITKEVGQALLVGLLTDTLFFSTSKTNAYSFQMTSEILAMGIDVPKLTLELQKELDKNEFKALTEILHHASFTHGGQVATAKVSYGKLREYNLEKMHTHNVLKFLRQIEGTRLYLVLVEEEDGAFKGSLRSDDPSLTINDIANQFDGGGHGQAAGFYVRNNVDEAIEYIHKQLTGKLDS